MAALPVWANFFSSRSSCQVEIVSHSAPSDNCPRRGSMAGSRGCLPRAWWCGRLAFGGTAAEAGRWLLFVAVAQ